MPKHHGNVPTEPSDTKAEIVTEIKDEAVKQGISTPEAIEKIETMHQPEALVDSMKMLQEQQQGTSQLEVFKPIEFEDLENLPVTPVDQNMANEIFQVAEEAKRQAQEYRATQQNEVVISDITQKELLEINQAPVNIEQLMGEIRSDKEIIASRNEDAKTLNELSVSDAKDDEEPGFFKRILYIKSVRRVS